LSPVATRSAAPFVHGSTLRALQAAARACEGCDLYRAATQVVFGAGPAAASMMLVGEQPGDQEDLTGAPFVGPAGHLLDACLAEAGIDRTAVYLTNAVKHFKYTVKGKRRIHSKPRVGELRACKPWLDRELELVQPTGLLALGASATAALLGPKVKLSDARGTPLTSELAAVVMVTVHPSSLLRTRDSTQRATARAHFIADLRAFAAHVARLR